MTPVPWRCGWPEAQVEELQLVTEMDGDILAFRESPHGRATRVVFDIDVAAFTETFLSRVETVRPLSGNGPRLVPTRQAK